MYNQTLVDKVQDVDPRYNVDRRALEERWQKPGDKVRFAGFSQDVNGANTEHVTRPTSRFVEDYNYLELATLNVGYEFGTEKLQKISWAPPKETLWFTRLGIVNSFTLKRHRSLRSQRSSRTGKYRPCSPRGSRTRGRNRYRRHLMRTTRNRNTGKYP